MNNQKETQTVQDESTRREPAPKTNLDRQKKVTVISWSVVGILAAVFILWKLSLPVPVTIIHPPRGVLLAEVFGTGTLESKTVVGVGSKIVGKVVEVLVDQGDTVTVGQTMARLEANDYENAVRVSEAALGQEKAQLDKAKLDLNRNRSLITSNAIPQADLDASETAYEVAAARVKNAEAQLGVARARLVDTQILSPVDGLVVKRNLEVGSTVVPGAPIFHVVDTKILWVQAMVDEHESGKLRVGQTAKIVFRANRDELFSGRLVRLAREADRVTEEREADVEVDPLPADWFIGAKADVLIEVARKVDALQIPKSAIVRNGVFIVSRGRAKWQEIQMGLIGRENVEVISGLNEEDKVIAQPFVGKKMIVSGQRVREVKSK
jgi:HlyD family secretion protein